MGNDSCRLNQGVPNPIAETVMSCMIGKSKPSISGSPEKGQSGMPDPSNTNRAGGRDAHNPIPKSPRDWAAPEDAHLKDSFFSKDGTQRFQAMVEPFRGLQPANGCLMNATLEPQRMAGKAHTQAAKSQVAHVAHYDTLTDLPDGLLLHDRLRMAIDLANRQGWQLALLVMDLDRFKRINDALGHTVGDQLLRSVAQRLVGCARQSDTICRQGGDEFMMLIPFIEHIEDAALCAQKLLAAFKLSHAIDGLDLCVSVSIGISIFPSDGQDAETLIKRADTAMHYAKGNGRNDYQFFEQRMNVRAVMRHSIEASLRLAVERQEFELHYQPKIQLQNLTIVGAEALIRWRHPERGLLPPKMFIAVAEDTGLILSIGRWALHEACRQAHAWQSAGLPPVSVAVNISATEFRAPDFIENLKGTLEKTGLEPHFLELEMTESLVMSDTGFSRTRLKEIADLGIQLVIDDFGTGYSSLSHLAQFPIAALKIDPSFVSQITSNADDANVIGAVINLAKNLRKRVIAEGVETPGQCLFLQAQGCDEAQGYYFGRPLEAEALTTLLQTGVSTTLFSP